MKRTLARDYRLFVFVASGLVWAGCQTPFPTSPPVTAAPSAVQRFTQPPAVASPEDVSFFGDHPDAERVPYESRLLTNMTRHTFSSVGRDFDPDLHADGQTLGFASTRNSEHPDIFLKHVDGYAVTQLTSDPADDIQPRFSPDSEKIVFCSNRTGNWDIWMLNRDGTGLTQLTHDPSDEVAPCWSPDGQRVAFTAWGRRSHQWEVWVLSVDRPGIRRFLCYGMFPDWSPNGQRITFQRARQRGTRWFSVWMVDLVGDEARHPTELAYSDSAACIAPRWSPDGKTIVYCTVRRTGVVQDNPEAVAADVWLVEAQSGTRLKLTDGAVSAFNPTWSSAGRIFFVSARSGIENIWSLNADIEAYPVGLRAGEDPKLSQAAANTPVETGGK
ncbi:MAG: TolB family protein [Phycisphaerae bacterium]